MGVEPPSAVVFDVLVKSIRRKEVVVRPNTYGTTTLFLEYFGLRGLQDIATAHIERDAQRGTTPPAPDAAKK
jgi:chromosome segregation and condensation protein ScpB